VATEDVGRMSVLGALRGYIGGLIKVKQTLLLVLTAYSAFIAGGGYAAEPLKHVELLLVSFIAVASVTAINMYFDRDIDALMPRTMTRPLAAGRLNPFAVLLASLLLLATSIILGYRLFNAWYALAIIIGFFFDIIAYTVLLKRRSPINIVAGAVAGGAPALGGWAAATGRIDAAAVLFSLIVASWVPAHIWFLATFYREDYVKAEVPMLPVVADPSVVGTAIGIAAMATGYSVAALGLMRAIGPLSTAYGLAVAAYMVYLAARYIDVKGSPRFARKAFIKVNSGLGLFYLMIIAERALHLW